MAAAAEHSGDWLNALPITSCGLRLDNEAVRVAVGLRLRCSLCQLHQCPCGAMVDTRNSHALSYRFSAGWQARHHYINQARSQGGLGVKPPRKVFPILEV
jgi:hypothetical protein